MDPDYMDSHAGRQPGSNLVADKDGQVLGGRDPATRPKVIDGVVDMAVVKAGHDFSVEDVVKFGQVHDHTGLGVDRTGDRHLAAVVVPMSLRQGVGTLLGEPPPGFARGETSTFRLR